MNKHQQAIWNRQLNQKLARVNKEKCLQFFGNLYRPCIGHETWRQFLMRFHSDGVSKGIYRQQLEGLREARVAYTLAKRNSFPSLYHWLRKSEKA